MHKVRKLQEKRGWAWATAVAIVKPLLMTTTRHDWIDGHKIPASGGCVVAVNHISHIDPLTLAWLQRSQGTVADGELLIVVWRGEVGVRTPQGFERAHQQSGATSATALWETVLVVAAKSETAWGWAPAGAPDEALSSSALAHQCVERLRAAYAECAP